MRLSDDYYKLGILIEYFGIGQADAHRGVGDCGATKLYDKLRVIAGGGTDEM